MQKYWVWLTTRKGLGPRSAYQAVQRFPSAEALYYADEAAYVAAGLTQYEPLLDKNLWLPQEILRRCYDRGISLLTWQDAAYPPQLRATDAPPLVLYYRGRLPDFNALTIGVVGTRKASAYGGLQARRLGYSLGHCGCIVVSGGAKGIDAAAMEGALTGGGTVIGVLGCGVDVVYPLSSRSLFEDVVWHGCLVSEYPPGTPPHSAHFPVRNRIISGLSHGVLVVEAPERSGALITAAAALEQGRDVFALPGNLGVSNFGGNHHLLREGAILVRDARDIVQEYAGSYPELFQRCVETEDPAVPPPPEEAAAPPAPVPEQPPGSISDEVLASLSLDEQSVCQVLRQGTMQIDNIVDEAQIPTGRTLAALTLLEVKGIVRRLPARRFCLTEAESCK